MVLCASKKKCIFTNFVLLQASITKKSINVIAFLLYIFLYPKLDFNKYYHKMHITSIICSFLSVSMYIFIIVFTYVLLITDLWCMMPEFVFFVRSVSKI